MKYILFLLGSILLTFHAFGQIINQPVIYTENYDVPSEWTIFGNATINNSKCNLNGVPGASYHKVLKAVGIEIPDDYWQSEFKFHINSPNPSGSGAGGVLLALTAGNLDFFSYDATQGFQETNQDGIAVILYSNSEFDNNINNWKFIIEAKKGNVRTYTNTGISVSSNISDYYITLRRENSGSVSLSVFENAQRTTHLPGSPIIFAIDPAISSLTHIQHGSITSANAARTLYGYIDSLQISSHIKDTLTCNANVLQEDFSNSTGWSLSGNSTISVGELSFYSAEGGVYHKAFKELSRTLSNSYWKSEVELILSGNNPTNEGVGASLIALTAGQLDFSTTSLTDSLIETNQDAIAAVLTSSTMYNNDINNWKVKIQSKKGNKRISSSAAINLSSVILHYYIRLERTNEIEAKLSIFSDSDFSQHLPGSPIYMYIDSGISNLNTAQIGSLTEGSYHRVFYGNFDNLTICDNISNTEIVNSDIITGFTIFPNPFDKDIYLSFSHPTLIEKICVYNILGELVHIEYPEKISSTYNLQIPNMRQGEYKVFIYTEKGEYISKTIVKFNN